MFGFKSSRLTPTGRRSGMSGTGKPRGILSLFSRRRMTGAGTPEVSIGSSRSQRSRLMRGLREALRQRRPK